MNEKSKKEKPLIEWMDHGDSDLMPVMMGSGHSTAASYFSTAVRREGTADSFVQKTEPTITPELVMQCSRETGIHVHSGLGRPTPFGIMDGIEDVEIEHREEQYEDGARRYTTIHTPCGDLSDIFLTPHGRPSMWEEHFIKSESDLPAWIHLIESAAQTVLDNPQVAEKVTADMTAEAQRWPGDVILMGCVGTPAFTLTCRSYIDPALAFYLLADHTSEMERMFEAEMSVAPVWLRCIAEAGADFNLHALNGLELYSPTIYEKYFVPQTQRIHDAAHALGLRTWVHTCGHMNKLNEMGVYEEMRLDVLESLSHPPLGDITDLRAFCAKLNSSMVTRGAVNVDLFYDEDRQNIRDRVRQVVEETQGHHHMIGDTNDSFPPYPRENILAVVDELDKLGVLLPA